MLIEATQYLSTRFSGRDFDPGLWSALAGKNNDTQAHLSELKPVVAAGLAMRAMMVGSRGRRLPAVRPSSSGRDEGCRPSNKCLPSLPFGQALMIQKKLLRPTPLEASVKAERSKFSQDLDSQFIVKLIRLFSCGFPYRNSRQVGAIEGYNGYGKIIPLVDYTAKIVGNLIGSNT